MPTDVRTTPSAPGAGVTIAVVDSGVHAAHPHVGSVAGGVAIEPDGVVGRDYADRMGHGTAVMAAITEKAPGADRYAVRIFDRKLAASSQTLLAAIDWAITARVHLVNLSLGTTNLAHRAEFERAVVRAQQAGVTIVAPRNDEGNEWLPGVLPGVVQVQVDWTCPRDRFRVTHEAGQRVFRASGFARPIPGVDPRRNLHGISFAVAHVTGFLARAMSLSPEKTADAALQRLEAFALSLDDAPAA